MITKEITLCSRQVTIGYCYATEIAYKDLADENIYEYVKETVNCLQQGIDPDPKKTVFVLIACMMAYYKNKEEEVPLKSEDLMYEATPTEIGMAIITIINMRAEFYHVPKGEPEDTTPSGKKGKGKTKN